MKTSLIVTVDTEEEGLWGAQYRPTGNSVENVRGVERFQSLCDSFGIRPTYLVDAPVVQDDGAVDLLRGIQEDGRAEIGAHLHPWCNPPFGEDVNTYNSYLCNLPESLQRDKLTWLTDAIEERFGRRPTSFRAGRYGLDIVGARILNELGYLVDSSVVPFTDYSADGGPNFANASHTPYYLDGDDVCDAHDSGFLLEVPVSIGFNRTDFASAHSLQQRLRNGWFRRLRVEGILDRLGILQRIKFSPEQANVRQLKQLVNAYHNQGCPTMVMMFHSSSLLPGCSPYVRNQADLERFYHTLNKTFEYCLSSRRMANRTLSECVTLLGAAGAALQV